MYAHIKNKRARIRIVLFVASSLDLETIFPR